MQNQKPGQSNPKREMNLVTIYKVYPRKKKFIMLNSRAEFLVIAIGNSHEVENSAPEVK
jgi:hypothetical protein